MKNNNEVLVQSILNAMLCIIEKYGLELMQRYPNDLMVHDKANLSRFAVPGAKFAWMVGHSHTHIVPLGFHSKEDLNVTYMTNLSSEDRFFVLDIGRDNKFKMNELDRNAFSDLKRTPNHYQRKGNISNFWLYRHDKKIGHVALKITWEQQNRKAHATITPMADISAHEHAALDIWCYHAATEMAGSFFIAIERNWAEPIRQQYAA